MTTHVIGQYQYSWTPRTQKIYESITSLRIPEARTLISQDKKANASNLIYPLLESYADFYQLFLNENKKPTPILHQPMCTMGLCLL
jgi:hypothetical protein